MLLPQKKLLSLFLTVLALALLVVIFVRKQRAPLPSGEETNPESVIWRMLDAARTSNSERYLSCYTGEMEQSLRRNSQEMGSGRFRQYISDSLRDVKGIAVSSSQTISPTEKRMSVVYVYQDRNEVQQIYLRIVDKKWKIFRVENAEHIKELVPYGTPVTD